MRMTHVHDDLEQVAFAERAAACFAKNPEYATYTDGADLIPGELLAIRWGLGNDCVVVVKLDDYFEPVNYQQLVRAVQEEA